MMSGAPSFSPAPSAYSRSRSPTNRRIRGWVPGCRCRKRQIAHGQAPFEPFSPLITRRLATPSFQSLGALAFGGSLIPETTCPFQRSLCENHPVSVTSPVIHDRPHLLALADALD